MTASESGILEIPMFIDGAPVRGEGRIDVVEPHAGKVVAALKTKFTGRMDFAKASAAVKAALGG